MSLDPSPYAKELLARLSLRVGFYPTQWAHFLTRQGDEPLTWEFPDGGTTQTKVIGIVALLAGQGYLTDGFLDQLAAEGPFTHRTRALDAIRVALFLREPPQPVVDRAFLDVLQEAALRAGMHHAARVSQLPVRVPVELRRRIPAWVLDDRDTVRALFSAANTQRPGVGDDLWLLALMDAIVQFADPSHRAGLAELRAQVALVAGDWQGDIAQLVAAGAGRLQAIVQRYGIELDGGAFHEEMGRALGRVCLIRDGGGDLGTGFLVGPDLVLSNHHVLARVISGDDPAEAIEFVFDFRTSANAVTSGPVAGLAGPDVADWLVDALPPTAAELDLDPAHEPAFDQATTDQLDFALVRLDRDLATPDERGYFRIDHAPPFTFGGGQTLMILGHPLAEAGGAARPITYTVAADAFKALNAARTRVQYRTNTRSGNSGSPVLNARWQVVALHHYGRPGRYNQGIPVEAIMGRAAVRTALEQRD